MSIEAFDKWIINNCFSIQHANVDTDAVVSAEDVQEYFQECEQHSAVRIAELEAKLTQAYVDLEKAKKEIIKLKSILIVMKENWQKVSKVEPFCTSPQDKTALMFEWAVGMDESYIAIWIH